MSNYLTHSELSALANAIDSLETVVCNTTEVGLALTAEVYDSNGELVGQLAATEDEGLVFYAVGDS